MSLQLQKDYILTELFITEEKNEKSVIVLEDEKMKEVRRGRVLFVNEQISDLGAGDVIWFKYDAGYKLNYDSKTCIIMHSDEILGVEEN